jgi:hypothetical protein
MPVRSVMLRMALPAVLLLSACGDSLVGPPPSGFGRFDGRLNGTDWHGYGWAVIANDTLYLFGRRDINTETGVAEELRFSAEFIGQGDHQISDGVHAQVDRGTVAFSAPASGQMRIVTYDGVVLIGNISVANSGTGAWAFEAGDFDVPVFFSFEEVPDFPGPALPPTPGS